MVGPDSHGVSRVPCYLGDRPSLPPPFRLQDYHLLWCLFPEASATDSVFYRPSMLHHGATGSHNPPHENARRLYIMRGLDCSRFARHYSGNPFPVSLPQGTEMFQFSSYRLPPRRDIPLLRGMGFPIRKFPDQCLLAAPRDLSQLATSFIAFCCQGIHHKPLVA